MDNERDAIDREYRKKILIVDDTVHKIGLLGRSTVMYQPPPFLFIDSRPNGRRRGQRRSGYNWNK